MIAQGGSRESQVIRSEKSTGGVGESCSWVIPSAKLTKDLFIARIIAGEIRDSDGSLSEIFLEGHGGGKEGVGRVSPESGGWFHRCQLVP